MTNMYELHYPAPTTAPTPTMGLTLVIAMTGYADAGQAVDGVATHLRNALDHETLATFDTDALMDYRSRRPMVRIEETRVTQAEDPTLSLQVMRDHGGRAFLLLSGPEPDLQWNAFAGAVADLVTQFKVQQTICLYSAPMPVPHTRPLIVTQHGQYIPTPTSFPHFEGTLGVPGSAALRIETELSSRGLSATGLTAHVPHYIAANEYPQAVLTLLDGIHTISSLEIPTQALEREAAKIQDQLAEQVEESPEVAAVVGTLETQYDREMERIKERNRNRLLAPGQDVPSGEELGAEFERYLAQLAETKPEQPAQETQPEEPEQEPQEQTPDTDSKESGSGGFRGFFRWGRRSS